MQYGFLLLLIIMIILIMDTMQEIGKSLIKILENNKI